MRQINRREALVLMVLDEVEKRGLAPVREFELHQVVRSTQEAGEFPDRFRYLDRPISFSYELSDYLRTLDRAHYVDEQFLVRNGWVPRREYSLTRIGRAQADEYRDRLADQDPNFLGYVERSVTDQTPLLQSRITLNPHRV